MIYTCNRTLFDCDLWPVLCLAETVESSSLPSKTIEKGTYKNATPGEVTTCAPTGDSHIVLSCAVGFNGALSDYARAVVIMSHLTNVLNYCKMIATLCCGLTILCIYGSFRQWMLCGVCGLHLSVRY